MVQEANCGMRADDVDDKTTVLVVHPDEAARARLAARIAQDDELRVVDERSDVTVDDVLLLMPDVLAVAAGHPALDAAALIEKTHVEAPVVVVVALADGAGDDHDGYRALAAGALAWVPADHPQPEVALKAAHRGEALLSGDQARELLADFDRIRPRLTDAEHAPTLTPTEREVLERLAKGERPHDIAEEYEVSDRLVSLHAGYAIGKVHWALDAERQLAARAAD